MDRSKSKIVGAFFGTMVEYYDYGLFGFSAGVIATKFFPEVIDPMAKLANLTNIFAIYAFAYLAKPLGSLIFGFVGDRYGRKIALSITITGGVTPTIIIGLLPEYSSIGVWSLYVLIICRFMQSLFIAGEYDGAAIYIIEHFGKKYHYTASAITRFAGAMGLLVAMGSTNFFSAHIFPEWGWRIPFLLSLPLALTALFYRRKLDETPDFADSPKQNFTMKEIFSLIKSQKKILLMMILFAGGFGATYQISIVFMKQYLPLVLPQSSMVISTVSVLFVLCFALAMPIAGLVADKIGIMKVLTCSFVCTMIGAITLFFAIKYQMLNLAIVASLSIATFIAPFNALAHGVVIKSFSVNERYRCISFGHTVGSMLMSGSAIYICTSFMKKYGLNMFPIIYLACFTIVAFGSFCYFQRQYTTK